MKNFIRNIWDTITFPFVSIAVIIDEDRRQNLDGSWDKYWAKKNRKAELRALKAQYKQDRKNINAKWEVIK